MDDRPKLKVQDLWNRVCIKVGDENAKYSVIFVSDDPDVEYPVRDIKWNEEKKRLELTI